MLLPQSWYWGSPAKIHAVIFVTPELRYALQTYR
jgi:hypothetical protein